VLPLSAAIISAGYAAAWADITNAFFAAATPVDLVALPLGFAYFFFRYLPSRHEPWMGGRARSMALSRSWVAQSIFTTYHATQVHYDLTPPPGVDGVPCVPLPAAAATPIDATVEEAKAAFPATGRFLVGAHPHGLVGHGCWAAFIAIHDKVYDVFVTRGMIPVVHTMNANFMVPFWRDITIKIGFTSCDRSSVVRALTGCSERELIKRAKEKAALKAAAPVPEPTKNGPATSRTAPAPAPAPSGAADWDPSQFAAGRIACLVPGGAEESLYACDHSTVKQRNRLGFVKVALHTDSHLVPMYSFGETELFRPWSAKHGASPPLIHRLKKWLHVGLPCIHGKFFTLAPYNSHLEIVMGRPIHARAIVAAMRNCALNSLTGPFTHAEVSAVHKVFVAHLEALYERNQPRYAPQYKPRLRVI
jgi:hypothetical protein